MLLLSEIESLCKQLLGTSKKLALVLTISTFVTEVNKKYKVALARILYIYYLLRFQKNNQNNVWALINSGSEINAMTPAYVSKLGFWVCYTNIGVEKIDGSIFETFRIVIASFQVKDSIKKAYFFQKTFLLTDNNMKIILKMSFFILSNADI